MPMMTRYSADAPSRAEVDAMSGPTVLEFGTDWCGWCQGAQAAIAGAFAQHPDLRHLKVEDGRGRPLGRSYGVKLWPTLIFLKDGAEVDRLVRPNESGPIAEAMGKIGG